MSSAGTRYLYLARRCCSVSGCGTSRSPRYITARFPEQPKPHATAEELKHGPELARLAADRFTGPVDGEDEHQLVITHAFLVAWLVRHATDAPNWRWLVLTPATPL